MRGAAHAARRVVHTFPVVARKRRKASAHLHGPAILHSRDNSLRDGNVAPGLNRARKNIPASLAWRERIASPVLSALRVGTYRRRMVSVRSEIRRTIFRPVECRRASLVPPPHPFSGSCSTPISILGPILPRVRFRPDEVKKFHVSRRRLMRSARGRCVGRGNASVDLPCGHCRVDIVSRLGLFIFRISPIRFDRQSRSDPLFYFDSKIPRRSTAPVFTVDVKTAITRESYYSRARARASACTLTQR